MEFISVGYESKKYLINRFILQECRNVVEGVWLWRTKCGRSITQLSVWLTFWWLLTLNGQFF